MTIHQADRLDPDLVRPCDLIKKWNPQSDVKQKQVVCQAATPKMNLSNEFDLEDYQTCAVASNKILQNAQDLPTALASG